MSPPTPEPAPVPRERALVWLLVSSGALLRFWGLGQRQLWLDEIMQRQCFSHPTLRENLTAVANLVASAPLDFLVQDFFVAVGGGSEFAARFHAALFGSLSLVVLYALAKRFFSSRVSLLGLLLFAVYPLHHHYSQEGRPYSLFLFLTLCSYYALGRALESRGPAAWVLFASVTALLFYTHYFAGLVLFSQGAFLTSLGPERVRKSLPVRLGASPPQLWLRFALAGGAAALLFLPWLRFSFSMTRWEAASLFSEPKLFLRLLREISDGGYPLSLLLLVFFGLGLRALWRSERWAAASLLTSWFLLPLPLILLLDWSRQYFFAIRQLLFATPAMFLGIAAGLEWVGAWRERASSGKKLQVASVLLMVVLSLGAIYRHRGREAADWKGVAAYLQAHLGEEDVVSAPASGPWLAYYYAEIARREVSVESLAETPEEGLGRTIYLVESIYTTPPQREAVRRLLRAAAVVDQKEFNGFRVYRLALGSGPPGR